MRGRFRTYEKYASVAFREGFREDEIAEAFVVKAERFESSYLENKGGGKFQLHNLPVEAQFAPIYGMMCGDFNGDGNLDVISVGNSFSTEVQTGRYDARGSLLMLGDGQGNFFPGTLQLKDSRDNKSIASIRTANGSSGIIIGSNSDSLKMYSINQKMNAVAVLPDETYAMVTDRNNKEYRQEFYYGNSFLSQGSRSLSIPADSRSVTLINYSGKKRTIKF
jgi:hypothetical protein